MYSSALLQSDCTTVNSEPSLLAEGFRKEATRKKQPLCCFSSPTTILPCDRSSGSAPRWAGGHGWFLGERPLVVLTSRACGQQLTGFSTRSAELECWETGSPALLWQWKSFHPSTEIFMWRKKVGSMCPRRSLLMWHNMEKNCWKPKLRQNKKG